MNTSIAQRASPSAPAIAVRDLSARPARGRGIEGVTLAVPPRSVTVLLGPPGSGKSALLRALAGLDRAQAGAVEVAGRDVSSVPPHRRGVGLVLQEIALFPRLTVADNVRFGLRVARWRAAERELRVAELSRAVGLPQRGEARVDELSAAEQLAVAIARAIAIGPRVLLLDEPLATIPPAERARERLALRVLLQRLQLSVVLATANVEDAMALATDLAIMSHGRLLQHGPVREVATRPLTADVARALGYVVLLEGRVEGDRINELGAGAIRRPEGGAFVGRVEVLVHPASLLAVPAGHGLGVGVSGAVVASQPLGPLWQLEVALGGRPAVLARWEWDDEPPGAGTIVDLATPLTGLLYFVKPSLTAAAAPPGGQFEGMTEPPRRLAETG